MITVGSRLGSYEIVAQLKSGGMASLFLARREGAGGFSRHVAIKVIHPHLAEDESLVKMFVDEARLSARIHHPNVVHIEELGNHEGTYFLAMEYVHGCSLWQLMKELGKEGRRFTPLLAVHLAMAVADGLHAAHEATDERGRPLEIVHRDVSPQNVLIAYRGFVKLIDFGVAKARGRAQETQSGTIKGKFRYMAPEQAGAKRVDRRTDVYALGIVLWEMLTGRRLIQGADDIELIMRARDPKVVPPSSLAADISPALDAEVLRALALSPDDRHPSANAFRGALARALPEAMTIDSVALSGLVRHVMADHIAAHEAKLPGSVTDVGELGNAETQDAAETPTTAVTKATPIESLTIPSAEVMLDDDASGPSVPPEEPSPAAVAVARATPSPRSIWPTLSLVVVTALVAVGGTWWALAGTGSEAADAGVVEEPEEIELVNAEPPTADPPAEAPNDAGTGTEAEGETEPPPADPETTEPIEPEPNERRRRTMRRSEPEAMEISPTPMMHGAEMAGPLIQDLSFDD